MNKEQLRLLSTYYLLGMEAIKDAEDRSDAYMILNDLWLQWGICHCVENLNRWERDGDDNLLWNSEWVFDYTSYDCAYIDGKSVGHQLYITDMLEAMQRRVDIIEYEIRKKEQEEAETTVRDY